MFYGNPIGVSEKSPSGQAYTPSMIYLNQSQLALKHLKLGKAVELNDARAGDLVYKRDPKRCAEVCGHQFLFDSWITTSSGDRIGFLGYGAHVGRGVSPFGYGSALGSGVSRKPFCFEVEPEQRSEERRRLCRNASFTRPEHVILSRLTP